MSNKQVSFPYYSGNIHIPNVIGYVTLDYFINAIKNPKPETLHILKQVKEAKKNNDTKLKRKLKQQLFSFTPAVIIPKNKTRSYKNIINWTGLMQIDLDGIETIHEATLIKQHIFDNYKSIVAAFFSPSYGVKCLLKTEVPKNLEHYKALHRGMVNTFEEYSYLDHATKNAVLPLFLSADTTILYRDYESAETWNYTDYSKPSYVRLNDTPQLQHIKNPDNYNISYNEEKVRRIITTRINNIIDNGHPQVRSTALVLGSRCAAGYIDKNAAENLILYLIRDNNYLAKNINGYAKTALWGINEGMKSPKYF